MKRKSSSTTAMSKRQKLGPKRRARSKGWVKRRGFEMSRPLFSKSVFPYERWATLKYCESYVTINPGAGGCTAYVFTTNNVFDPNATGVGHQPTGFDQYMAMYNKFVVYASKIKVIGYNLDTETADVIAGVAIIDDPATYVSTERYLEQALTDWQVIPAGAGASTVQFETAFNATAFSGTIVGTNDLLHGSSSTGPGKQWYYHVFGGATNTTDDPGTVKYSVEIEYRVKFFDPRTVNLS